MGGDVRFEDNPVQATYDTVADDYAAYFPGTEAEEPIDLAMLDHFVSVLPTSRLVLDAGCGTGRIARYLTDRGCRVNGLDLSPGMLRMARRDLPDFPTAVGSIVELPIADQSVDGVAYWYSTIHVADRLLPTVLAEAARVLRKGGYAIFAFQSGCGVRDVGPAYAGFGHDVRLLRYSRTIDQVATVATGVGLEAVAQLTRAPRKHEKDPQAFLLTRRSPWSSTEGGGA